MDEHRERWWESPTVELGKVVHLPLESPFETVHGARLPAIQVSYESWGELNAARDNTVLVVHPMTSDCHVTGAFADQPQGWWEALFGPGRAIDTDRYHVVCPNLVGGCYGTTGPRFPAEDGEPWYWRFPLLTPRDMMRVQRLFLRALGIERVHMVIGPSMGGMVAWEWAIEAPDEVGIAAVVAAPLRTTAHQIGMNWLQRRGIELDIPENEVVARFGQMLARGVGMLSYRSPVGLEEKFGREWFKQPGATLGERGMFNIESWLRFHGKRITQRFDPFTYLLFSRAMDLHDVSAGRDDFVAALDRVTCHVLVVGISSDYLYPPDEVHLGADILHHLGRDVRYAEIRSLHGHDAFLLETEQLGAILRDRERPRRRPVPTRADREVRKVRVGILGAGRVAASFLRLVEDRRADLVGTHGLDIDVRAVAEIDRGKKLDPVFDAIEIQHEPERLVAREDLDVIVELTRGVSAYPLVEQALRRRRPVVTPNKPLVRQYGRTLERLALQHGVRLAYHDSIAAGWPLMYTLERPLARSEITDIQAMLSSSCNVILERIEDGGTFETALAEVVERDLVEPDPMLDVSGWDAAQKLGILLARALGRRYGTDGMASRGVRDLDESLVRAARDLDLRVKLVALANLEGEVPLACVRPMAVPMDSHLGAVRGINHVVVLQTRQQGEIVQLGPGAGTLPVATAVLNDMIGLLDARRSWTGRFPMAMDSPRAPSFELHLAPRGERAVRTDRPERGSIPILESAPG